MNKTLMLTLAAATLAAGATYAETSDMGDKLRDAAANADKAATEKSAELKAAAEVSNSEVKADAEANAAVKDDSVTGTVKHRVKQAGHKVSKAGSKVKEEYHGAMADHYENKAAADISASLKAE